VGVLLFFILIVRACVRECVVVFFYGKEKGKA